MLGVSRLHIMGDKRENKTLMAACVMCIVYVFSARKIEIVKLIEHWTKQIGINKCTVRTRSLEIMYLQKMK